ncbi:hypothetical protein Q5P01_004173 [Channa striata]|uniref:non-specific serine/threonine protein kinase n=1 Tax=Channa striata TaxID=64152 RepID=A0AA88NM97_CHASR|nr:hypothetical protein Q5P01_004173 [Channa striata]
MRVRTTKSKASTQTGAASKKFRDKFTYTSESVERAGDQRHGHNTVTDEPSEPPVVTVRVRATKSKVSKAAGAATHTSEFLERAGENVVKKASAEQLPATQTPETTTTERGCDVSPSSSCPCASRRSNESLSFNGKTSRADIRAKYLQLRKLGEGGFGSVYAGIRKVDNLPVAIKHIPQANVERQSAVLNGVRYMVPTEVLLLLKVAGPETMGRTAVVSLLDWYDLEQEVLLIMERPVPAVDLLKYLDNNNGPLKEYTAKIIMKQLVEAAIQIQSKGVFHRDIKVENVLIQTTSDGLQVRIIDFGCGCMSRMRPFHTFAGTSAYAPPEFYMYGKYKSGPTTVWQLGALLYEITDGYRQFKTTKFLRKWVKFNKKLSIAPVFPPREVCVRVRCHQRRARRGRSRQVDVDGEDAALLTGINQLSAGTV